MMPLADGAAFHGAPTPTSTGHWAERPGLAPAPHQWMPSGPDNVGNIWGGATSRSEGDVQGRASPGSLLTGAFLPPPAPLQVEALCKHLPTVTQRPQPSCRKGCWHAGYNHAVQSRTAWAPEAAQPLASCVTRGQPLSLCVPRLPTCSVSTVIKAPVPLGRWEEGVSSPWGPAHRCERHRCP